MYQIKRLLDCNFLFSTYLVYSNHQNKCCSLLGLCKATTFHFIDFLSDGNKLTLHSNSWNWWFLVPVRHHFQVLENVSIYTWNVSCSRSRTMEFYHQPKTTLKWTAAIGLAQMDVQLWAEVALRIDGLASPVRLCWNGDLTGSCGRQTSSPWGCAY